MNFLWGRDYPRGEFSERGFFAKQGEFSGREFFAKMGEILQGGIIHTPR